MPLSMLKNTALTELYHLLRRLPPKADLWTFALEVSPGMASWLEPYLRLAADRHDELLGDSYASFCRSFLCHWVKEHDPPIFRSAHFGRRVILSAIDPDMHDIFRHAGLLSELYEGTPAFDWWRAMGLIAQKRAVPTDETNRAAIGFSGELAVFRQERRRCEAVSEVHHPRLVSLEDSTLGWDIESFRSVAGKPTPIYLEVKTTSHLDHLYLTWREAQMCTLLPGQWMLVIVDPRQMQLRYYSAVFVRDLLPTIKVDGVRWNTCMVPTSLFSEVACEYSHAISEAEFSAITS